MSVSDAPAQVRTDPERVHPSDVPSARDGASGLTGPNRRDRWKGLSPFSSAPDRPFVTPAGRAGVALVAVALLVVALLGRLLGQQGVASAALAIFLLTSSAAGPCLLVLRGRALSTASLVLTSVAASLTLLVVGGFLMALTGLWYPVVALWLVLAAAVVTLALSLAADLPACVTAGRVTRTSVLAAVPSGVLSAAGLAMVVIGSLPRLVQPEVDGLLGSVGPAWYVGVLLLVAAVVLAAVRRTGLAVPVMALLTVVVLSQAVMYGAPTVVSAGRHMGITQYIETFGSISPGSDIYQAFPGLFAASAWVLEAAGIGDPMTLATWLPVLLAPSTALAVRVLAGRFVTPGRAWVAALLFSLGNAVNTIYFAPQSIGLVFALAIAALVVGHGSARISALRLSAVLVLSVVLAVTHQISPYLIAAAVIALVAFRLVRPWWIALVVLGPAVLWTAANFGVIARFLDLGSLLQFWNNIAPPVTDGLVNPPARINTLVFLLPAALLVLIGLAALWTVWRRRDRLHIGLLVTAASAGTLFLATSYGQEGIFRVAMFALPWLSILAVQAFPAGLVRRVPVRAGLAVALVALMGANVFSLTGMDWSRLVRPDNVAAVRQFETTAPEGSVMLITGSGRGTTGRLTQDYQRTRSVSRDILLNFPGLDAGYDAATDVDQLTDDFITYTPGVTHYALVADAIGAWGDRYGMQSFANYRELADAMATDPEWTRVYQGPTSSLYQLTSDLGPTP